MNSPDTQLRDVLGRMADEAPEPIPFDDLGVHQLQPTVRASAWSRRPASVLVLAAVSVLIVGLFSVIVFGPGGESSPATPSFDGRTYYESLDLSSPESAVQTFTEAFAADDFMTVWLVFDAGAQLEVQDHFSLGAYDQLVDYDRFPDDVVESSPFPSLSEWESWDEWWMFDHLMLQADDHDAFLIDLSRTVTVTSENLSGDEAELTANVQGVDGPVTFRLYESATGKWRVNQVKVPDGDADSVPWGA